MIIIFYDTQEYRLRPGEAPEIAQAAILPIIANADYVGVMATMNISLPDSLKAFVEEQVAERQYSTSSEYLRELIRRDQDRTRLRGLLLDGGASAPGRPVDGHYFDGLRDRARRLDQE